MHTSEWAPRMNFAWEILAICMYNHHLVMLMRNSLRQTCVPCLRVGFGNLSFTLTHSSFLL